MHNGINLSSAQSFVESVNTMRQSDSPKNVKIYAKEVNGKVETYASDNKKGWFAGKRQAKKSAAAKSALAAFVKIVGGQHLTKDEMITANVLVASIFIDSDHSFDNLQKLSNLLENAAGIEPKQNNSGDLRHEVDEEAEMQELYNALESGEKGLLNPKSDFTKSITKSIVPKSKTQQKTGLDYFSFKELEDPQSKKSSSKPHSQVRTYRQRNDVY